MHASLLSSPYSSWCVRPRVILETPSLTPSPSSLSNPDVRSPLSLRRSTKSKAQQASQIHELTQGGSSTSHSSGEPSQNLPTLRFFHTATFLAFLSCDFRLQKSSPSLFYTNLLCEELLGTSSSFLFHRPSSVPGTTSFLEISLLSRGRRGRSWIHVAVPRGRSTFEFAERRSGGRRDTRVSSPQIVCFVDEIIGIEEGITFHRSRGYIHSKKVYKYKPRPHTPLFR